MAGEIVMVILDILKFTIPGLVVFFTVYHLFKKYLNAQINLESMKLNKDIRSETLPLKLQAYERLSLFIERISIMPLANRLITPEMTVGSMRSAMMIAIEQEYHHNVSQQIYVSEPLWKIIQLSKNENLNLIANAGSTLPASEPANKFVQQLALAERELDINPIEQAKAAIRKEVSLLF